MKKNTRRAATKSKNRQSQIVNRKSTRTWRVTGTAMVPVQFAMNLQASTAAGAMAHCEAILNFPAKDSPANKHPYIVPNTVDFVGVCHFTAKDAKPI